MNYIKNLKIQLKLKIQQKIENELKLEATVKIMKYRKNFHIQWKLKNTGSIVKIETTVKNWNTAKIKKIQCKS